MYPHERKILLENDCKETEELKSETKAYPWVPLLHIQILISIKEETTKVKKSKGTKEKTKDMPLGSDYRLTVMT